MADFSFLNVGPDVEDDEATNTENQAFEASHAAASKNPVRVNLDAEAQQDPISRLKTIQHGLIDIYDAKRPLLSAERMDPSFNLQDLKKMDPVGFFNTYGNKMASQSFMQDTSQLQEKMAEAQGIIKGMQPNRPAEPTAQQKAMKAMPNAYTPAEKATGQIGAPEQQPQQQQGGINDPIVNMDHAFTAAGLPRREAIQSLTEMRRIVAMEGIDTSAAVSPLSFIPTYTNLISHIFNPQVANKMLADMVPKQEEQPQQQGRESQQSTFGSDKLEQDPRFMRNEAMIAQHENRHAQVIQELANSGTFKNVGDVLGFVLTSFILGPKVAGLFFSNMEKNGRLRDELNILDHETTQLYHQQNSYIQLAQHARAMAAGEEHQKTMEAENARHHWAVEGYMKSKSIDKSGWSPEDKQTDTALQHAYRYQRANLDSQEKKVMEMGKVIDRGPLDPDFKAVQGALGNERRKLAQMRGDFDQWRIKVNEWYKRHGADAVDAGTNLTDLNN